MNRFGCTITSSLDILRWHLCVDTLPAADLVVDPVRESLDTGVGVEAEASAIAVVSQRGVYVVDAVVSRPATRARIWTWPTIIRTYGTRRNYWLWILI